MTSLETDVFGVYTGVAFGYGVFLKDEFMDTCLAAQELHFEVEMDINYHAVTLNSSDGTYTISEETYYPEFSGSEKRVATIYDRRNTALYKAPAVEAALKDVFDNSVAASIIGSSDTIMGGAGSAVGIYSNPQITRVKGTLLLCNEPALKDIIQVSMSPTAEAPAGESVQVFAPAEVPAAEAPAAQAPAA